MTIEQLDKVDVIANDNEKVILVISDHLEWDDQNEKLLLLQDKLNLYLSFIESGEIFEQYPIAKGKLLKFGLFQSISQTAKLKNSFHWFQK